MPITLCVINYRQ